jgi:hypothetical protein
VTAKDGCKPRRLSGQKASIPQLAEALARKPVDVPAIDHRERAAVEQD